MKYRQLWDRFCTEKTSAESTPGGKPRRKMKPWLRIVGWTLYALVLTRLIQIHAILCIVTMLAVLLVRLIFASRAGSRRLRLLRQNYHRALREDLPFTLSKKRILADTLTVMSPYMAIWGLSGMIIPLGGMSGWALFAFPMLFLTGCVCTLLADAWKDLELGKLRYWGFFFLCYLISLLPGIVLAVIQS